MKKLRVFRVTPQVYDAYVEHTAPVRNRSESIRSLLVQAKAAPPERFPKRGIKPDLKAFAVFMGDSEIDALAKLSQEANVSRNVFMEALLMRAATSYTPAQ